MSTLSQFLGGGGIKSIQRGSTEFAGIVNFDNLSDRTFINVPITPVSKSKSVVTATVAGDVIYDDDNRVAINSNASIRLANTGTITYVGGTSSITSSNLTLTGLQSGDFVLFFSASDDQDQNNLLLAGWSAIPGLTTQPDNDEDPNSAAFYKFSTGTSVTASGLASNSVQVMIAFRGVKDIPFDVNATESSATSGMPDPLSITPISDQCMSVIVGFLDDDVIASSVTAPSGYTLAVVEDASASTKCTVMTAYKNLEQASIENPGAFGGSGDDYNKAVTIALRQNVVGSTISSLSITIGGALAGKNSSGGHLAKNQTGVIDWQVVEYED